MLQEKELSASTHACPQHTCLSLAPPKLEPAALFGNELLTTRGVKAEARG